MGMVVMLGMCVGWVRDEVCVRISAGVMKEAVQLLGCESWLCIKHLKNISLTSNVSYVEPLPSQLIAIRVFV